MNDFFASGIYWKKKTKYLINKSIMLGRHRRLSEAEEKQKNRRCKQQKYSHLGSKEMDVGDR